MNDMAFCPYEDVLGADNSMGVSSLLIPGYGEASYYAIEDNCFATKKQDALGEVIPNMITSDPNSSGILTLTYKLFLMKLRRTSKKRRQTSRRRTRQEGV
jgi:U3 small nucleolar RNA-associated protein 7